MLSMNAFNRCPTSIRSLSRKARSHSTCHKDRPKHRPPRSKQEVEVSRSFRTKRFDECLHKEMRGGPDIPPRLNDRRHCFIGIVQRQGCCRKPELR